MKSNKNKYEKRGFINVRSAFDFDGVDDYAVIDSNDLPVTITDSFSISFCINPSTKTNQYIFSQADTSEQGTHIYIASGSLFLLFGDSGATTTNAYKVSVASFPADVFSHVVITYAGAIGTEKIYINSQKREWSTVLDSTPVGAVGTTSTFIGNRAVPASNEFDGLIASVSVFDKALNQSEINNIYSWQGYINESAGADCILQQTLQFDTIAELMELNGADPSNVITAESQANSFVQYQVVYNASGTWAVADGTDPNKYGVRFVLATGTPNFTLADYGFHDIVGHGLGAVNDLLYCSPSGVITNQPTGVNIGIVTTIDQIHIGQLSDLNPYSIGSEKQFNYLKTVGVDVIAEASKAKILGKTLDECRAWDKNSSFPTNYLHKDFYSIDKYYNWYNAGLVFNNSVSYLLTNYSTDNYTVQKTWCIHYRNSQDNGEATSYLYDARVGSLNGVAIFLQDGGLRFALYQGVNVYNSSIILSEKELENGRSSFGNCIVIKSDGTFGPGGGR